MVWTGLDDQDVHALLQEGVDLLGLGVLVVLAIDDGDGVAMSFRYSSRSVRYRVMKLSAN